MNFLPTLLLAIQVLFLNITTDAFGIRTFPTPQTRTVPFRSSSSSSSFSSLSASPDASNHIGYDDLKERTLQINNPHRIGAFDPLGMNDDWSTILPPDQHCYRTTKTDGSDCDNSDTAIAVAATTASTLFLLPIQSANAVSLSMGEFDPSNFKPICPASDSLYRVLQTTAQQLVGPESFVEYGPLIASGLLRVRLELCVIESFFGEAIVPFIQREGLGWVLPFHETVETFVAGTIFALASTFVLVGGSKVVSVVLTYGDVFVGWPLRLFGGFGYDRARGVAVTWDVGIGPWKKRLVGPKVEKGKNDGKNDADASDNALDWSNAKPQDLPFVVIFGSLKAVGETSKVTREVVEGFDLFVGRYLTLIATAYIGIKFLHYKVFPDFPF